MKTNRSLYHFLTDEAVHLTRAEYFFMFLLFSLGFYEIAKILEKLGLGAESSSFLAVSAVIAIYGLFIVLPRKFEKHEI